MDRPTRNPEIIWRTEKKRESRARELLLQGEDVAEVGTVTLIGAGTMHQLNLVGGMIWSLCDGSRSVEQIAEALSAEFDVEREEALDDAREFVDDLGRRGWLVDG